MGRKSEFSPEEKITAVRLTTDGGRTVLSVANEYGVHENTIMKWKRQYKTNPDLAFSGQNGETPPDETERLWTEDNQLLITLFVYFADIHSRMDAGINDF